MFCGLNAKKIIALYLILKIWSQKFGVSSFHFCSVYKTIRSRMSLIMGLIGTEHLELFALELENCYFSLCLHFSIYKCQPISTKLDHNIYDNKIWDEFDYGSDRTRTSGDICP